FKAHHDFGRCAYEGQIAVEAEQEHIWGRIERPQRPIQRQWIGAGAAAESLRDNNLEGVAIADIFFGPFDARFKFRLLDVGDERLTQRDRFGHGLWHWTIKGCRQTINAAHSIVISPISITVHA